MIFVECLCNAWRNLNTRATNPIPQNNTVFVKYSQKEKDTQSITNKS